MEEHARCPVCIAHPGWAHADESHRSSPRDYCIACFGSGTDIVLKSDPIGLLASIRRLTDDATFALDDEAEGDFTLAVRRLANRTATLVNLIERW